MAISIQQAQALVGRLHSSLDESSDELADLIDACVEVLQMMDGIEAARGLIGEREDVYGAQIADALALLIPLIFRLGKVIEFGGWHDALRWYLTPEQLDALASLTQQPPAPSASE